MNYIYFIASLTLIILGFFGMFTIANSTQDQVLFLSIYTFGFWFMCHFGGLIVDGEQQGKY